MVISASTLACQGPQAAAAMSAWRVATDSTDRTSFNVRIAEPCVILGSLRRVFGYGELLARNALHLAIAPHRQVSHG